MSLWWYANTSCRTQRPSAYATSSPLHRIRYQCPRAPLTTRHTSRTNSEPPLFRCPFAPPSHQLTTTGHHNHASQHAPLNQPPQHPRHPASPSRRRFRHLPPPPIHFLSCPLHRYELQPQAQEYFRLRNLPHHLRRSHGSDWKSNPQLHEGEEGVGES